MVAATSSRDICFNFAALPASRQITVLNPAEVPASYSSICLRGGDAGGTVVGDRSARDERNLRQRDRRFTLDWRQMVARWMIGTVLEQ